jgi:hypothetical protein
MDTYKIEAEVYPSNRVQIITVEDSYGADIDLDDFSEAEKSSIMGKALAARDQLDMLGDEDDGEDDNEAYA